MSRLELHDIHKHYPNVIANDGISLRVEAGRIHALLGENGAGKSTLMKIIYGAVQPDSGTIRWKGEAITLRSPAQARALGIAMVFQHFSLFDSLSVLDNIWLGLSPQWSRAEVRQRLTALCQRLKLTLDADALVDTLSVGERQRVEIVRALLTEPELLILDEPTSVLTPQAAQDLFVLLRQLASEGCAIVYISHKLDEIRQLCDVCTVLRAGRVVDEVIPADCDNDALARLMLGNDPPTLPPRQSGRGDLRLSVTTPTARLELHAGEIVGIAGVSGSGQKALMAQLAGETAGGAVQLDGRDIARMSPQQRRRLGIHWVPEERLGRGAVPPLSLHDNTLLTRRDDLTTRQGWILRHKALTLAQRVIKTFGVKAPSASTSAQQLSGGNLQKFIVGREIDAAPSVLLVSQPTWGVDVGAASHIHRALLALRDQGCALLVVSEDLTELFALSDRIHVMANGRLSPGVACQDTTMTQIGAWMSGLWDSHRDDGADDAPQRPHPPMKKFPHVDA
ncbi:ABC transporter ATP-binding protein [Amphibiibacter pelophylacis]|uniref:ABC transporter ATP-binding protein n=1 Tax=Amphibiibacter pelophylacis TaxID=1799477 RepID=A0ACC6P1I3_9BURK